MTQERRPSRSQGYHKNTNNQLLLLLVGVLSVVLIVLVVIGANISKSISSNPTESQLSSVPGTETTTSTAPSTQATVPPTTIPPTTVPPTTAPALPVTPSGGKYIDVGSGYVAEVIQANVETFEGKTTDDYSYPTNNYLPKGTVDYCASELVYGSTEYVLLRSGHRVYLNKKIYPPVEIVPEVKQYAGTLPDHNEIGIVSLETVGRHSVLMLDCLWKAPFYFDTNQKGYANPNGGKDRDFAVSGMNATYVDITFCYATSVTGNLVIPSGHPLFKSAELIQNESDCTLRLHLRKTGGFYGWHAYYNDQGQLCFQFLNPAKASAGENAYGADLSGVTVMIDVGHGGLDGGAVAKDAQGQELDEAYLNLLLAKAVRTELEKTGATVIFNREADTSININNRLRDLMDKSPDICIAIHQNSFSSEKVSGFDCMYFTPWSQLLAKNIHKYTETSGVYAKTHLKWSVNYFMMRQSLCPVVLTENGYMSNPDDLAAMLDPVKVQAKAQAIAQGVADYFLAINK